MAIWPPPPFLLLPQDPVADHGDDQDAVQEAHQPQVQPHVAVQRVAELVGDDALELVPGQKVQAAAGHADHRVPRAEAGGERVDALLRVEHVHRGHGHARGQGHLLDHVQQPALLEVARVGLDRPPAEQAAHGGAASAQGRDLVEGAGGDHGQGQGGDPDEGRQVPDVDVGVRLVARPHEDQAHGQVDAEHDQDHGHDEEHDQAAGAAAGLFLVLEEVHGR
jgi:hypothetical protein